MREQAEQAERRRLAELLRLKQEREADRREKELQIIHEEAITESSRDRVISDGIRTFRLLQKADTAVDELLPIEDENVMNEVLARFEEEVQMEERIMLDGAGATLLIPRRCEGASDRASGNFKGSTRTISTLGSSTCNGTATTASGSLSSTTSIFNRRGSDDLRPKSGGLLGPNPALLRGSNGEPSPISRGLHLASRLASLSQMLEKQLADATDARDGAAIQRALRYKAVLHDSISKRLDAMTWCMLQAAPEYAVEMKDGTREVLISDSYGPLVACAGDQASSDLTSGGEVLLWANLGPGKVTRLKTVQSGIAAGGGGGCGSTAGSERPTSRTQGAGLPTLSVDLTKQVASLNTALRITRSAYDNAAADASMAARQQAKIAANIDAASGRAAIRPRSGVASFAAAVHTDLCSGVASFAAPTAGRTSSAHGHSHGHAHVSKDRGKPPKPAAAAAAACSAAALALGTAAAEHAASPSGGVGEASDAVSATGQPDLESSATATATPAPAVAAAVAKPTPDEAKLQVVGDVITVELLALPEPPVAVGGIALSFHNPAASPPFTVHRLPHPAASQGASAATQAIKVKAAVPAYVIVPDSLTVARWEPADTSLVDSDRDNRGQPTSTTPQDALAFKGRWVADGISDASFDAQLRVLTFRTLRTAAHAMVQPRFTDLPYVDWSLRPILPARTRKYTFDASAPTAVDRQLTSPVVRAGDDRRPATAALLTLRTQRFTLAIAVEGHLCCLVAPQLPELAHLTCSCEGAPMEEGEMSGPVWLPPGQLLFALQKCGINLMPDVSARKGAFMVPSNNSPGRSDVAIA